MKLNNKGFAISTIMYLILVLVIILMVSTLFILSSKNLILDKQKSEVLNNIYNICNPVNSKNLTRKSDGTPLGQVPSGKYLPGDEYVCNVDGTNLYHFYILETVGDSVSLIMASNYDTTTQSWCASGNSSTCNADGLTSKLDEIKEKWKNINNDRIVLPTAYQIASAAGNPNWEGTRDYSLEHSPWLYDYLNNYKGDQVHPVAGLNGYWTSSAYNSSVAWYVSSAGNLFNDNDVSDSKDYGVRPVIILTKKDIQVFEKYGDVNNDGVVTPVDLNILEEYISGSEVKIDERNADVFFDGVIDEKDIEVLRRYMQEIILDLPVYQLDDLPQTIHNNGEIVYFDVDTGKTCTNYTSSQSNHGVKSGCMKFYVFNDNGGDRLNLLLDHNTSSAVWNSSGSNNNGPNELLNQLNLDTANWKGTLEPKNYVMDQTGSPSGAKYTINYSGYKARLITADEIAKITGNSSWNINSDAGFYFDTNINSSSSVCNSENLSGCKYGWLYDRTYTSCTSYGCLNNSDVNILGYWTASSRSAATNGAWYIIYIGALANGGIDGSKGVRPVIEILRSNI